MTPRFLATSVAISNLLVPLNSTMIVVALPQVARDLGVDVSATAWIVTSYLIAMASLQPIGGRIGDRFGRRRIMLGALVYFAAASVGAALASSLLLLAFFRLNQAIAASALAPNGVGLLREVVPAGRRGGAFGIVSAASGVGATAGPLVGGLLASFDWRAIFFVNVPVCAIALALAWRLVPPRAPRREVRFDSVGALWLGALLVGAAWVLVSLGHGGDPATAVIAALLVPLAIALLRFERRQTDPALPPTLLRVRAFTAACATVTLQNLAMYGALLALPVALAGASVRSGIALAAFSGGSILLAPIGGRAADRWGPRWPALGGALVLAAGLAPLAASVPAMPFDALVVTLGVAGVGLALTFPAMRLAAVEAVEERYAALASGVFSTSRYFGGMLGSIAVAIALAGTPTASELRLLFGALAAAAFAAAVPSLALPGEGVGAAPPVAEEAVG
jgi:EmrB/QacA subfamily drug resistance transporter